MNATPLNRIIAIVLVAGTSLLNLSAEPEIKGSPAELAAYLSSLPGSIQLVGEGEVKVPSDRAVLSLRIDAESKSLAETLKENQQVRARLMKYLGEQKIRPENIKPAPFTAIPRTAIFSDKVKSYKLSALIKVTTTNENEFSAVAGAVDQISDVAFVQSEFEHSDEDGLRDRAIREACDEVERQKRIYEEKLGVKLVPRNIQDHRAAAEPVPGRNYGAGSAYAVPGAYALESMTKTSGYAAEATVAGSTFGELVFKARVTVQYAVERK
jgi:uncharacterized protein YggE